ncbi:hypothetical protein RDI58_003873 [Solanum bulbocastanum]|uniref:Pectinesterase catalytic domain-containing protein n=1 Tax=Solanum bulbocastanum TaxID=147425 RepID=A0AAN8U5F5_SOLBU
MNVAMSDSKRDPLILLAIRVVEDVVKCAATTIGSLPNNSSRGSSSGLLMLQSKNTRNASIGCGCLLDFGRGLVNRNKLQMGSSMSYQEQGGSSSGHGGDAGTHGMRSKSASRLRISMLSLHYFCQGSIDMKWSYKEKVEIGKTKKNLMLVGDGMDATIISGNLNVLDGATTFNSVIVCKNIFFLTITFALFKCHWDWATKAPSCGPSFWSRSVRCQQLQNRCIPGHSLHPHIPSIL